MYFKIKKMSGFAFQKLNGGQTTANKQLNELEEINEDLDGVIAVLESIEDSSIKPEIWKLAKMFHPDRELIPVQWAHRMETGSSAPGVRYSRDNKLYYGALQIQLVITEANNNNTRTFSHLELFKDGVSQALFRDGYKGSNDWKMDSLHATFVGYFDTVELMCNRQYCRAQIEFQGFEIGERTVIPDPTEPDEEFQLRVHGLDDHGGRMWWSEGAMSYELFEGVNFVPANITKVIYTLWDDGFTLYYKENPIGIQSTDIGGNRQAVDLPESPITGDIDVFIGDHDNPYEPEFINFLQVTFDNVNVSELDVFDSNNTLIPVTKEQDGDSSLFYYHIDVSEGGYKVKFDGSASSSYLRFSDEFGGMISFENAQKDDFVAVPVGTRIITIQSWI